MGRSEPNRGGWWMKKFNSFLGYEEELQEVATGKKLSIRKIPKKVREKYNIKVGQLTPFTGMLITK